MQPVSTVVFLFQTAVSAPLPSNLLTDDALARYEWVIRDNLAVSDMSKVIPRMMIQRLLNAVSREYMQNNVTAQLWRLLCRKTKKGRPNFFIDESFPMSLL